MPGLWSIEYNLLLPNEFICIEGYGRLSRQLFTKSIKHEKLRIKRIVCGVIRIGYRKEDVGDQFEYSELPQEARIFVEVNSIEIDI